MDGFFGLELRVPKLPHYSRYHRILRNAERLLAELALYRTGGQPDPPDRQQATTGGEPEALTKPILSALGQTLLLVEVSRGQEGI